MNIHVLRQELQKPRRHQDSLYGKYVMRRLSIYVTAALAPLPVSPFWVNAASIVSGVAGAWFLSLGEWVWGIFLVNLWYLLDHVDGELARYRRVFYATGLFLDSMANVIVIPAAFAGLGAGLGRLETGIAAAYGSLMLFVVPYCESAVILQRFRQGRICLEPPSSAAPAESAEPKSFPKKTFSLLHELVTFPVFLPAVTLMIFGLAFVNDFLLEQGLGFLLQVYAVLANLVWAALVAHRVKSLKIDKTHPPVSS